MKKRLFLIIAAVLTVSFSAYAQYDDEYEIVVTDANGNRQEIDIPEAMTFEVDSLLNLYYSKTFLADDANCTTSSSDPEFSEQEYIDRLNRLPHIVPMPYNEVVRKFIDRYTKSGRRSVGYMLAAMNFYTPIFEQALETFGVPLELKYLPVVESGLNPSAVSHAGAAGLWQFMIQTGKRYGLRVNSLVDDRRDPIKSSYAAAELLSDLYRVFGDWHLALAAYNCGPENVNRAIHRAGGSKDYWTIYQYLPRETRGYVPAFIAANYVMNYYCEHNICPMRSTLPEKADTVMVDRDVSFNTISDFCGISMEQLRALNPQYRRDVVNGSSEPSAISLPPAKVLAFIDNQQKIYEQSSSVTFSDNIDNSYYSEPRAYSEPQRSYSSSQRNSYNNSYNSYNKARGKVGSSSRNSYSKASKLSKRHKSSGRWGTKSSSRRKQKTQSVTIKQGETLSSLARKHGTTVKKLQQINGIKGSNIRAGKKLRVK
ncbi:MAG: transglycosylase SLT domain-containing protein [Prevotella sp.]|uniref:lytic transglycosylase domain-containing protein n=1 Tax=Prevotella sp. TaxID=59823 RepID=UPI002A31C9C8|nr:transglycosylase SLT domain-containing protein [Prevotella sp.]MDD7317958.1 transglycosylase SLT domain-containing protein [Prevotellaceae bacterium]MDY4020422.1 transglycosylase SLT domain-containing protein [Prevotella sp.]